MSTNPAARTPGPDHRAISTASPAIDLGNSKAIAGGVTGGVVAFLTALSVAYQDQAVSGGEWINIALATVIALAAGFGVTYATPTTVTFK